VSEGKFGKAKVIRYIGGSGLNLRLIKSSFFRLSGITNCHYFDESSHFTKLDEDELSLVASQLCNKIGKKNGLLW
jgi:hypothetical protein